MNTKHTHFSAPSLTFETLLNKKEGGESICAAHILTVWSMLKLPVDSPLRKTESFFTNTPARELHFSIIITTIRIPFDGRWKRNDAYILSLRAMLVWVALDNLDVLALCCHLEL